MRPTPLTERLLLSLALVMGTVHVLDESLWHLSPGVPRDRHLPGVIFVMVVVTVLLLVTPRLRPLARAAVAGTAGALILANGSNHAIHAYLMGSLEQADVTGVLAAATGVLLLGLAVRASALAVRHRSRRTESAFRRWGRRVGVTVAAVTTLFLVLIPAVVGIVQTHSLRSPLGDAPGVGYRSVTFAANDGIRLAGWYRASTNGAAVVLVSSARGDRAPTTRHARLLADHGYGVLLYDARGTGQSDGDPNGYGWGWQNDVSGAVTFLESQPDVRDGRVGALGLSTGADVLLETGADDHRLRAIVTDGATGRSSKDVVPQALHDPVGWVSTQALFGSVRLWSGQRPGAPLVELVPRISPTPLLLVASGSIPQELPANRRYAAAARQPVTLWQLPEVDHTSAIAQVPEDYERKVVGFLDRHLLT